MKEQKDECAFTDCLAEDGSALHFRELIQRGYHLLPLASDGITVIRLKGGERICIYLK